MIKIINKADCCGCTACFSVCPKKCINMIPDEEGFLYPKIDEQNCINCHLCEKVCPIIQKPKNTIPFLGYCINNKKINIREISSSGGFFYSVALQTIEDGGVVYGVSFSNGKIIHCKASKVNEIISMLGSKYVQSNLGSIFSEVKKDVLTGRKVCFCGTPCQVSGLCYFLGKEYDNLILIDIVCHGVSSPLLWGKYVMYMEKKYKSRIVNVNFRNKTYGYHSSTMKLVLKNGKSIYQSGRTDLLLKCFFNEISSRPSCYSCKFKSQNRLSDFTMFDCWHFQEATGLLDDNSGHSNVLVNTGKDF